MLASSSLLGNGGGHRRRSGPAAAAARSDLGGAAALPTGAAGASALGAGLAGWRLEAQRGELFSAGGRELQRYGVLLSVLNLLLFPIAYGLWRLRPWAWTLAMALQECC